MIDDSNFNTERLYTNTILQIINRDANHDNKNWLLDSGKKPEL